jgi:hypothetical protein
VKPKLLTDLDNARADLHAKFPHHACGDLDHFIYLVNYYRGSHTESPSALQPG